MSCSTDICIYPRRHDDHIRANITYISNIHKVHTLEFSSCFGSNISAFVIFVSANFAEMSCHFGLFDLVLMKKIE